MSVLTVICLQIVCKFLKRVYCENENKSVMTATISTILDTRRIKKTSKYPVKLRVTFERATEYYQTVFDLAKAQYEKLTASRIATELQVIRLFPNSNITSKVLSFCDGPRSF